MLVHLTTLYVYIKRAFAKMLPIFLFISLITLNKLSIFAINVDIKIGFLVGSKRLKHDQTYSRPGRHLIHAFNYSIYEINRNSFVGDKTSSDQRDTKRITFTPIVAETYGNESESIKQTVDLITKHRVDFIVGPQESCQIESKLASVFNIGMISHYCTPIYKSQQIFELKSSEHHFPPNPQTYIQTKPPYWKIVDRVTTLVSRLIHLQNRYPQQLVLLYFKEQSANVADKRPQLLTLTDSTYSQPQNPHSHSSLSNEAIQYKLIGELLEIKLNELLLATNKGREDDRGGGMLLKDNNGYESRSKRKPLVVLNWHTTFHYGYTKNPFRQLIRRYLFQQQLHSTTAFVNQSIQCAPSTPTLVTTTHHYHGLRRRHAITATATTTTATTTTNTPISSDHSGNSKLIPRASIYIVVGHYYEHLGLMLALNELGLLESYQPLSQSQQQQQPLRHRSSVLANQQQSLVIGVDIEQYDERDDSVRFLRGLLMDESGNSRQQQSRPEEDLDSIAAMYRSYLGVVPAKPIKSAEFLDGIRKLYDQSNANSDRETAQQQQQQQQQPNQHLQKISVGSTALSNQTSTTVDTIQITHRLLQLIRLPVEAFYLHDSVKLLGEFLNHCIIRKNLTLSECREGSRAFEWFKERKYSSFVNQNLTNFDSQAQTEGLYTLITRKLPSSNESNDAEDEFGLVPVGRFVTSNIGSNKLVFDIDSSSIDPIWFPLWCDVSGSNLSKCLNISYDTSNYNTFEEISSSSNTQAVVLVGLIILVIVFIVCLAIARFAFKNKLQKSETQTRDNKWFNSEDEENFLNIVHNYLLSLDNFLTVCKDTADYETNQLSDDYEHFALVELHCYMFPFPSCKFVHWLTALHHIKEMMFQYQIESSSNSNGNKSQSRKQPLVKRIFELFYNEEDEDGKCIPNDRNFFASKHKGTASLRLILNKYRSINECFCNLSKLNHATVAKLKGVTLSYGLRGVGESKLARLVVEHPDRGNLRECFKYLPNILDENEINDFKTLILLPLISDLLNGLEYLHKSSVKFHGELRSTTCMITTNWRLKLSGFQVQHLRRSLGEYEQKNLTFKELEGLIYSAPEVLENCYKRSTLSYETLKLADIYSFAFVIYEMFVGEEPWKCLTQVSKSKLLIERVKVDSSFRPPLSRVDEKKAHLFKYTGEMKFDLELLKRVIRSCWSYSVELRPKSIEALRSMLEPAFSISPSSSSSFPSHATSLALKNLSTTTKTPKIIEESTCSSATLIAVSGINAANFTQLACSTEAPETYTSSLVPTITSFNKDTLTTCFSKLTSTPEDNDVDFIVRYYTKILEHSLVVHRKELDFEKKISNALRMKLLPRNIVSKLCNGKKIVSRKFDCISLCSFRFMITLDQSNQNEILFIDFLNKILSQLDKLVESYQNHIHLLDSQVDSSLRYIAYSGKPLCAVNRGEEEEKSESENEKEDEGGIYNHAQLIASFALQLVDLVNSWQTSRNSNKHYIQVTCGLHSGSVVAGMISNNNNNNGDNNFNNHLMSNSLMRYVLLGSSICFVNVLEQTCHPQKIHISSEFKNLLISSPIKLPIDLKDINAHRGYVVVHKEGRIETKKFGDINSYWLLNGPRLSASQSLMMIS